MNNLNQVLIEGHLCQNPEMKQPIPGTFVCTFIIGVNRSFMAKNGKGPYATETSFFPIHVWGDLAILCEKYLTQGRGVRIVGRLKQERWGLETETPRQRVVIIAEHVEFMPEKKKQEDKVLDEESKAMINANDNFKVSDSSETDVASSCMPNEEQEITETVEDPTQPQE